jgi:hypothetical protein
VHEAEQVHRSIGPAEQYVSDADGRWSPRRRGGPVDRVLDDLAQRAGVDGLDVLQVQAAGARRVGAQAG